jgi:hypothetical protein
VCNPPNSTISSSNCSFVILGLSYTVFFTKLPFNSASSIKDKKSCSDSSGGVLAKINFPFVIRVVGNKILLTTFLSSLHVPASSTIEICESPPRSFSWCPESVPAN